MPTQRAPEDIPRLLWLWLPLPMIVVALGAGAFSNNFYPVASPQWYAQMTWYHRWFHAENGVIENATAAVLVCACTMAVFVLKRSAALEMVWVRRWLALMLLGTVYFTGEEISWGQQILGWETPRWYSEATGNRQNETNLHNINSWFNQKPRHLFQAWVIVGGIFVPLRRRLRRRYPDPETNASYWFWPTWVCTMTAVLAMACRSPEWIVELADIHYRNPVYGWLMLAPPAETQEYCMAMFLLLYFCSIYYRLNHLGQPQRVAAGIEPAVDRSATVPSFEAGRQHRE